MSKAHSPGSKSAKKIGRSAVSGRFVSAKTAAASRSTAVVIERTSKRYSKALKELAKK